VLRDAAELARLRRHHEAANRPVRRVPSIRPGAGPAASRASNAWSANCRPQYSIGDLQRNLVLRDRDLELLLAQRRTKRTAPIDRRLRDARAGLRGPPRLHRRRASDPRQEHRGLPHGQRQRRRAPARPPDTDPPSPDRLDAVAQADDDGQSTARQRPDGGMPLKILSCPVMHGAQRVLGVLVLFKSDKAARLRPRQVRIVELLARRVAYILLNAYDPTTGLLTRRPSRSACRRCCRPRR